MNLLYSAVNLIKDFFNQEETINQARLSPNFFSRKRKISNNDFLSFCLVHAPTSMTTSIRNFFLSANKAIPSKQAISQKRSQISEWPFKEAFNQLRDLSLPILKPVERFGYYILALDGSTVNLPNVRELREEFGTSGRKHKCASSRLSSCVDIQSGLILDAAMVPYSLGERALASHHIRSVSQFLEPKDCIVTMDRGYFSKKLMKELDDMGYRFVMRMRLKFNLDIDDAPTDAIVTIDSIKYRVSKFVLSSGEVEVLITNLLDMDYMDLFEIYSMRWGIETTYLKLKVKLQLENFTGKLPQVILQDFWIVLIQYTLLTLQSYLANELIVSRPKNSYNYRINFNNLVGILRENLIYLLTEDEEKTKRRLRSMLNLATKEKVALRPGRHTKRVISTSTRFQINIKYN